MATKLTVLSNGSLRVEGEIELVDAQGNVYAGEVGPVQGVTKFIPRLKR